MTRPSILIAEDERIIAFNLKSKLEKFGYQVPASVATGQEAIERAGEHMPDLVLMDIMLEGDMDGVQAAIAIHEQFKIPIVYLTASSDEETVERAKKTEPLGYIIKPFEENILRITIEMALYKSSMENRLRVSEERIGHINNCFLNFGPDPIGNIKMLNSVCGELLHADGVFYQRQDQEKVAIVSSWKMPSILEPFDEAECRLFHEAVMQESPDTFVMHYGDSYDEQQTAFSEIWSSCVGQTVPLHSEFKGSLCAVFREQYQPGEAENKIMGIIAAAIGIEEDRRLAEEMKEKFQNQLIQSQKLEAIGTMAGGVAHEINNPLMGIINYAQLIFDRIPSEDVVIREYCDEIIKEGERIAGIVRNLLAFSRQDDEGFSGAQASKMVSRALGLTRRLIEKDEIVLNIDIPENLPLISCRNQQIEQVILNLLTNARDALNERFPGYHADKRINISASLYEQDDAPPMIRITVEDFGAGVEDAASDKLFDPFFSTKPKNKGTGLGLSVSYGIIKEHGGELSFESEADKGSRFYIDLPILDSST